MEYEIVEKSVTEENETTRKPDQVIKPPLTKNEVPELVQRFYGMTVKELKQMNSYDDLTFHIKVDRDQSNPNIACVDDEGYTFKIVNWFESEDPGFLESIQDIQRHIHSKGISVPIPVKTVNGSYISRISLPSKETGTQKRYAVQMNTFLPGITFSSIPYTQDALFQFGQLLARLTDAYQDVKSPVLEKRKPLWSLYGIPKLVSFLFAVEDEDRKNLAMETINNFEKTVLPAVKKLPKVIIHGDFNENNVIVRPLDKEGTYEVYGVLDFTDNHWAPIVFEVAIALVYAMLECTVMDQLVAGGHALAGYLSRRSLSQMELSLLKTCIEIRLTQSLVIGAHTFSQDPKNLYVISTSFKGWDLLKKLKETTEEELQLKWQEVIQSYNIK